ncbi:MAG TPA: preprotein translocase subunit SecA [Candidatus Hydrogenedentes bacterium]|nr:preprotein translocase subunit SecA [Candidatus Hydrogenedentota bacterium]HOK90550.1 preprotein translocase subunit SecA [Candidatus Hydrogenedentota bacterium]
MFFALLKKLFGTHAEREVKRYMPIVEQVRALEPRISAMTNDQLRVQTARFKQMLDQGATLDDLLPEAFATAREAAKRVAGLRPFDVQVIGGIVLHQGGIAEMVTGEGKTLVAVLPCYLNALTGRGVHVITVNDYLARRDAEWMGPIHQFLGLTVGLIQHDMNTWERQVGYRADITYGTNHEFGFDYLRDNMAVHPDLRVQRELHYAIVDEVDSILIDEARTPLIISGRPEKSTDVYLKVDEVVRRLRKDEHYTVDEKQKHIILTDEGMEACERMLGVDDLFTTQNIGLVHIIEQSLKAHNFFKRDDEYIVRDGEVLIIDEFTGRALEGRRFSDGLHQAIEAKERVPIRFESQTIATITYQNYFRLYEKLAGMTGTAATEAVEFEQTYGLKVVQIPTNLPLIRKDLNDLIFATERGKFRYVVREILDIHQTGRPILVGTVSIEKSELLARMLEEAGIRDYQVLNAKHHEREAAIIANAGKRGAITIATNMAGRGTDIKLAEGVRELGGLCIIGTERHESRRIDNQLRGRCGRQGDPGTTRFYVSLEDEVARLFGGPRVKRLLEMFGGQEEIDEEPLNQRMVSRSIERAQRQVEEYNFEIRKHLLDYDQVMDRQRKYIYALRREVLEDHDVTERLREMFENIIDDLVEQYAPEKELPDQWDLEGLEARLESLFNMSFRMEPDPDDPGRSLRDSLVDQVHAEYTRREEKLANLLERQYRDTYGAPPEGIDFRRMARQRIHGLELMVILRTVDDKWVDHLYQMDYLRESVRLRAFGQRDPLLEYKQEAFELFNEMIRSIEEEVTQALFRLTDLDAKSGAAQEKAYARLGAYSEITMGPRRDRSFASFDTSRFVLGGQEFRRFEEESRMPAAVGAASARGGSVSGPGSSTGTAEKRQPVRAAPKVGPNDPCPCGSGKKYKKCCGKRED